MAKYSFDNVTIDGFRGLRHLELNDLGLVNLLVGENNSGKTSVLEAMSILCDPYNPGEWLSMVGRRDFGRLDETRVQSLRWCFDQSFPMEPHAHEVCGSCKLSGHAGGIFRELHVEAVTCVGFPESNGTPSQALDYAREKLALSQQDVEQEKGIKIAHRVTSDSAETKSVEFYYYDRIGGFGRDAIESSLKVQSETLTPCSYQINERQVSRLSQRLLQPEIQGLVLELMQQFDPDIVDIEVASLWGERPAIYFIHKRLGPAPLSTFGDAIRRALLLATTIPSLSPGGLLLIDELETGIHVSALERVFAWLMKMARRFQVQVMATTHSLEAVDAITKVAGEQIDDLVAFQLHQVEEGTKAKRIAGEMLMRLRYERGLDVR